MLTQWFQPEPTFKGLPLARALRDRGHEVEVLTGFPNYPGGKLYPGYRVRPWRRETIDGIRVNRVALYPSHDRSGLGRILNYLSFGASAALIGPWLVRKPDVIYVYNLVTLVFASRLLRLFKGCKSILDVQDLWPESVAGSGMMKSRILLGVLDRWCRAAYRHADRLIVLSPGFKRHLVTRGVPEDKIDVIYNWCDETALPSGPRLEIVRRNSASLGDSTSYSPEQWGSCRRSTRSSSAREDLHDRVPDVLFTFRRWRH